MSELTATVAETRANFSKIAAAVNRTKRPVTVLRNSKPWVVISPVDDSPQAPIPNIDWATVDVIDIDPALGFAILPAQLDDDDEGLYDDLV
ncbi:MAG: type II toxin-antitoxin system prevent-host-death family antitoxin [Coriobacteriia bacterium]|nr:type II toxin-antitoxin system prevent-host-death family antitoxin [Coriobacteriia bacterium]